MLPEAPPQRSRAINYVGDRAPSAQAEKETPRDRNSGSRGEVLDSTQSLPPPEKTPTSTRGDSSEASIRTTVVPPTDEEFTTEAQTIPRWFVFICVLAILGAVFFIAELGVFSGRSGGSSGTPSSRAPTNNATSLPTPSSTIAFNMVAPGSPQPPRRETISSKVPGMMRRWTNGEGKVIEAAFEGWDGSDHILLQLPDGIIHRYPLERLSPLSKQLANNNGIPKVLTWMNRSGKEILATFEGLSVDHVLLGTADGLTHEYPLEQLSPGSQKQALNISAMLDASTPK